MLAMIALTAALPATPLPPQVTVVARAKIISAVSSTGGKDMRFKTQIVRGVLIVE